ncbi:glycosyltransferase [Salinilacihabitans rarus]|uniref:glycosyltransferase n=1 Tax=Salinilacihabitans rarus TaxID=2961596 RepID=UPI0020C8866E|nr:glycosyltransferase [Salinilacihabitans rarus]
MVERVVAFTDTYLPTVNGVTYAVRAWRDRWLRRGGRMDVVFPAGDHDPDRFEHPVGSVALPFYDGYRLGGPRLPDAVAADADAVDVVHAHTPFAVGLAALRLARRAGAPLVATYHTPAPAYVRYLAPTDRLAAALGRATDAYERWFYGRADLVLAPTRTTRRHLRERVALDAPVRVVSNGVDLERFRPVDATAFRERYGLDAPVVGYTGRHGHEKNLGELLEAVAGLDDVTLVLGGDGPARDRLERRAAGLGVDARFLGFRDRSELPELYAALDAFAHPSPVETQGLVALESIACGTPVVAVDAGALAETVDEGATGYRYRPGDVGAFRAAIRRTLAERGALERGCLAARERLGLDRSLDRAQRLYEAVCDRERAAVEEP